MKRSISDREKTKMPVKTTSNQDDDYQLSDSDKKITTTRFYSLRGGVVKRSQEPEVIHLEDSEEEENQTSSQTSSSSSKKRRSSPENQNRQAMNTSKTKKEEENKTLGNISTISAQATCSQKSTSSEHNKNNTISKSSAETPSKQQQPNQDNIEPTSDESTCQANQVVKTKSKSNSIVCEKLNIKKRHLEKCALKMLNLISLEGSLEINCKYIQLGGFRNADPFTIKFHDNGEIELDVNDDEDTISVILGDVDINFAAGFFFDPLFGIIFAIEESTAKMYINKLKELSSYDNSIKPDHKSNSELLLVFQITHEEENIIAQKLYLYFKKSCDLRRERQKTESSKKIDFNFGFLKESRAREVLYEAFLNREKPSEIEKFIGSYTPISPEQCIKYPLNSDSSLTITVEDLKCLKDGEFLNDNIISFYLKYIYHDLINDKDRKRTHIFDTFFYQRLTDGTRRKGEGFSNSPSKRHAKVKNWTRNVNIFEKDFLIVPINKRAHWFMAIICYPYLLEPVTEEDTNTNDEEPSQSSSSQKSDKTITRSASKKKWLDEFSQYISSDANKALSTTSEATNETIIDDDDDNNSDYEKRVIKKMSVYKNCVKMPIILIFDSLSASKCHMVMNNLREYLIAEWKTRHPNDTEEEIDKYVKAFKELCGFCVRVPQQKNFYDCGIFMLQYVESFFQNPISKYDLPIRLDNWFDEEVTDSKREKIRRIIEDVAQKQKESKQEKQSKKD